MIIILLHYLLIHFQEPDHKTERTFPNPVHTLGSSYTGIKYIYINKI